MRFHVPTTIIFKSGALSSLAEVVDSLKASRIVLVTDKGILISGIADKVLSQVQPSLIIDTIEQNPRSATVNKAAEAVRTITPDLIIGLGGGSSLDAAKALAVLATNPGFIEDYEGNQKYINAPLPVLAIPTTCGTGSEVTWVSVITHTERKFKMSIKGPLMYPKVALIDPDVLVTLPRHLIASTGMDAFTHALEAYTVKPRTVITDIFAKKALELIFKSLEKAYKDITCKKAREDIMLGSTLAGMAFGNSDVGAVHCIAETVGGLYDVPHGVANSIFLPFVMEANLCVVKERYADIARLIGIEGKEDGAALKLIEEVRSLSQTLNIPSFRSLNIKESDFLEIAKRSVQNNSNLSNPREMRTEEYVEILTEAFREP